MSAFIVHGIPGSPFTRAVLAALEEKGAPWRFAAVPPTALRSPEHLARHPFGRVPVLEHDGFILYETQAILRHIDRTLPTPALTPADPRAAARMDQVIAINDWYLFHGAASVIGFQRVVGPRFLGIPTDEAAVAAAVPAARAAFRELARILGDEPYFTGSDLSLADLMVAPQIDFLALTPEWPTLSAPHRNLVAWLDRMNSRPSFVATTLERVAAAAGFSK